MIFKYLNDNRRKCVLGVGDFMPENCRVVAPCEIATFDIDMTDDDVVFIKTWKHDDKILICKAPRSAWEVQSGQEKDAGNSGE